MWSPVTGPECAGKDDMSRASMQVTHPVQRHDMSQSFILSLRFLGRGIVLPQKERQTQSYMQVASETHAWTTYPRFRGLRATRHLARGTDGTPMRAHTRRWHRSGEAPANHLMLGATQARLNLRHESCIKHRKATETIEPSRHRVEGRPRAMQWTGPLCGRYTFIGAPAPCRMISSGYGQTWQSLVGCHRPSCAMRMDICSTPTHASGPTHRLPREAALRDSVWRKAPQR